MAVLLEMMLNDDGVEVFLICVMIESGFLSECEHVGTSLYLFLFF